MKTNRPGLYGAIVWIFAATVIFTYISFALLGGKLPGVEQLLAFLSSVSGPWFYVAAFIAIFLEGLYFLGTFFPGTTLVLLIAILSQVGGPFHFLGTMVCIFLGWSLAGAVNILMARTYRGLTKTVDGADAEVHDNILLTWFPAFRATYEVQQVAEGGDPVKVLWSSVRVKFLVSVAMAIGATIIPFFIDINELSNEEGFTTLGVVAVIMLLVGGVKLRAALRHTPIAE